MAKYSAIKRRQSTDDMLKTYAKTWATYCSCKLTDNLMTSHQCNGKEIVVPCISDVLWTAQSTAISTWLCGLRPFWVGRNVDLSEGFSHPGRFPYANHFFAVLFSERPQKAARSLSEIGRLFSLFFFCLSLACVLILILLLMSGKFIITLALSFPVQCAPVM